MQERDALNRLQSVISEVLGEAVVLDSSTTADDVEGWDSVKTVEIAVAVEAEFGMRFNLGEIAQLDDVGALARLVAERAADAR